jgi:hypothetical protein
MNKKIFGAGLVIVFLCVAVTANSQVKPRGAPVKEKIAPQIITGVQMLPQKCSVGDFSLARLYLGQKVTLYGYEFHFYSIGHNDSANVSYTPLSSEPYGTAGAIMFREPGVVCESIPGGNVGILLLERGTNVVTLLIGMLPDWACQ